MMENGECKMENVKWKMGQLSINNCSKFSISGKK